MLVVMAMTMPFAGSRLRMGGGAEKEAANAETAEAQATNGWMAVQIRLDGVA